MSYHKYCREETDGSGRLVSFSAQYPENFNFAYDVVDEIAESDPQKTAIV